MRRISRRRLLGSAAAGLATLAGCSSGDGGPKTTVPTNATSRTTQTAATETASSTAPDEAQREVALEFVVSLANKDYATAYERTTGSLRTKVSAASLERIWTRNTAEFGDFVSITGTTKTTVDGYDAVFVRLRFQGGVLAVQVTLAGTGVVGLFFTASHQGSYSPPEYADQSAFEERTFSLSSPACTLGATLSVPTDGAETGVVLVHGSGPQDRDQTTGPNKPFKDLAWGLATRGVAVLRYQKRTYACDVETDELGFDALVLDDALTALDRLRAETSVDAAAVVGHSLGGYAAPRIAAADGDAAAFSLAGPTRPLYDLPPDQIRYLAELDGTVTSREQDRIESAEAMAERLANRNYEDGGFSWSAAFWRAVSDYDPVETATDLSRPASALQGGRDYQVSPVKDFDAWEAALPDARTRLYDDLNHLFIAGEGDPRPDEYFQPGNVASAVVTDLASWLTA
jgi:pimeloyl-ACP methyl ester carboxylesterase